MRASLVPVALLLASTTAVAQAPRITPAGDPSVRSDTIYRLAVDPAKYPESQVAVLLDDGVVTVEADGRTTRTYRMVTQLLKPDAEENYQEHTFSYAPGHQRMTVNWVRVVRPDGQVISDAPSHVQDSDVPAQEGDPVYSDRKVRRVSLTGVKAGTIVDWSYTVEELKPFLAGDFYLSWSVNPGAYVARSRYIVDAPASLELRIRETNLDFKRQTRVAGGRRTHTWARADIPVVRPEPLAADSNGVYMSIAIASPTTWTDIAKWYDGNARSRYTLGADVQRAVSQLVAGARSREDTIRAVHRWVAQDIRYVSIALGLGGYQPRTPDETVRTGFGDCKDKATLFIAALAHLGIEARAVLLSSSGTAERDLPSIDQFDHVIAAVVRGGDYQYVDLTADLMPYGWIPFSYQGAFGLVVRPGGVAEEITFPRKPLEANVARSLLVGRISDEGIFDGTYTEEVEGSHQASFRENFRHPLDSATRANAASAIARNYFDGAIGDSLQGFDGSDLGATPRFRVVIRGGRAAEPASDNMILRLPLKTMRTLGDAARELEREPARRFPIDPVKFWGYGVGTTEVRFTLPAGWRAQLPKGVTATSAFGSFTSEYVQAGNELVIRRRTTGAGGIQPPDKMPEFIAWLRAVASDDARMIVLERASAVQTSRP